uniref:Uncharacterized protein n=1 Tax=Angiostrongylus cantonensis TaxID=6313 RepID=A0A0K0DQK3_ANGCA
MRLHEICDQPEDSQQVRGIEMELLRAAQRSKQNEEVCGEGTFLCLAFGVSPLDEKSWWGNIDMQFY